MPDPIAPRSVSKPFQRRRKIKDRRRRIYWRTSIFAQGPAIIGSATGTSNLTGALKTTPKLTGTVAGVSVATGSLTIIGAANLVGATHGFGTVDGAPNTPGSLTTQINRVQGDDFILDPIGHQLLQVDGATVIYYKADGVTPHTIYTAAVGNTTITQPLTTRHGRVEPLVGGTEWWHEPGARIRHVTHADGRILPVLRQETVDSENLTSVDSGSAAFSTLYASPTGSDANDGRLSTSPKTLQGALNALLEFGPVLTGTWTINLAAGTYVGAFSYPDGLRSRNRVRIFGPAVGVSPAVPTAIINCAGLGNGLILGVDSYTQVKDIKVINASTLDSATAAGFHAEWGSNTWYNNCHAAGNAAYAGVSSDGIRTYVTGGVLTGTQTHGWRFYSGVFTLGYNSTSTTNGPKCVGAATLDAILAQNAYGDAFFATLDGNPYNAVATTGGRIRLDSCDIKNATIAGVKAQEGSHVVGIPAGNTMTGNLVDLILTGASTSFELHENAIFEARVKHDTAALAFNNTFPGFVAGIASQLKSGLYTVPLSDVGNQTRVVVTGTMAGLGTKTPSVRLLSTDYLSFVSSVDYAGEFQIEVIVRYTALGAQLITGTYSEVASTAYARSTRAITLTGAQSYRVYGTLSNSAGSMVIESVDVYV